MFVSLFVLILINVIYFLVVCGLLFWVKSMKNIGKAQCVAFISLPIVIALWIMSDVMMIFVF